MKGRRSSSNCRRTEALLWSLGRRIAHFRHVGSADRAVLPVFGGWKVASLRRYVKADGPDRPTACRIGANTFTQS